MKEVIKLLAKARTSISKKSIKKKGHNDYSNYDYFTPEQIATITQEMADEVGLFNKFDLKRDTTGEITGTLGVWVQETGESIEFTMATAIPIIKATNAAQQLGGAMTYTERYLLMTAYNIKDNALDPDSTHQTKRSEKEKEEQVDEKKWLNKWLDKEHTKENPYYWKIVKNAVEKDKSIEDIKQFYKISKAVEEELKTDMAATF